MPYPEEGAEIWGWSQALKPNLRWDDSILCCWLKELYVNLGEPVRLICSSQGAELFASLP